MTVTLFLELPSQLTILQISATALSKDGKILIVAETDVLYVWNFPYRAILSANSEPDVKQILFITGEKRFLTASHKNEPDTQPSILVVCRNVPLGDVVYTFEFNINKFLPVVITPDDHYVVGVGYDAAVKREHVRVYHLRKGVFLHKISLKYQNFKEIKDIVSFHLCYVALIDNEKANVINCTEKKFSRSIKYWSGQMTR